MGSWRRGKKGLGYPQGPPQRPLKPRGLLGESQPELPRGAWPQEGVQRSRFPALPHIRLTHEGRLPLLLDEEELAPVSTAGLHPENHQVASGEHPEVGGQQQLLEGALLLWGAWQGVGRPQTRLWGPHHSLTSPRDRVHPPGQG